MRRKAYTMVELLTVMAIFAIVATVVVIPLISSFNATRQAQAFAEAQEKARALAEKISRDIQSSVGVRDNAGDKGSVDVMMPAKTGAPNPYIAVLLPYAKLDLVKPAEGTPELDAGGNPVYRDPITGKIDPTLQVPKGQVNFPLAPGQSFVRYFVGARDPLNVSLPYNDPYSGLLMTANASQDNLTILYRAEVPLYVLVQDPAFPGDPAKKKLQINTDYFLPDADNDGLPDDIDDPAFFTLLPGVDYNTGTKALTVVGAAKAVRIANWQKIAVIQTAVSRYDAILPVYDKNTRQVAYDGDAPRLIPLIQFMPGRVNNEPIVGSVVARQGDETDNSAAIGPDVLTSRLGAWSNPVVRLYNSDYLASDVTRDKYILGRFTTVNPLDFMEYGWDPDDAANAGFTDLEKGIELFDVYAYENGFGGKKNYPFSQALQSATSISNWLGDVSLFATWRPRFKPFYPLYRDGKIFTSFSILEVGDTSAAAADPTNFPTVAEGPAQGPLVDPGVGAFWSPKDPGVTAGNPYQINRAFNRAWNNYAFLRPDIHRYIDLRATPQPDGTASPLDPITGFPGYITPGSELVIGPDQNPGPNFGHGVRYTRVTDKPGPNQYKINYADLPEPPDYTLLGFPGQPAGTYDPTDYESAGFQARFKAGYVQLNSDPNVPLPVGYPDPGNPAITIPVPVQVTYRFQFNQPKDLLAVDYDTRQQISLRLTVRNFSHESVPNPQTVTITSSAIVRNFLR